MSRLTNGFCAVLRKTFPTLLAGLLVAIPFKSAMAAGQGTAGSGKPASAGSVCYDKKTDSYIISGRPLSAEEISYALRAKAGDIPGSLKDAKACGLETPPKDVRGSVPNRAGLGPSPGG
jgi:hypothetical protein